MLLLTSGWISKAAGSFLYFVPLAFQVRWLADTRSTYSLNSKLKRKSCWNSSTGTMKVSSNTVHQSNTHSAACSVLLAASYFYASFWSRFILQSVLSKLHIYLHIVKISFLFPWRIVFGSLACVSLSKNLDTQLKWKEQRTSGKFGAVTALPGEEIHIVPIWEFP